MFQLDDVLCKLILSYVNGANHRRLIRDLNSHQYVAVYWEVITETRETPTSYQHTNPKAIIFVNTDSVILSDVYLPNDGTRHKTYKVYFSDIPKIFSHFITYKELWDDLEFEMESREYEPLD